MAKERISREDLELLFGKMVAEKELTILGFKNKLAFEVYDGFAYCPDYRGSEYTLIFPKVEFVNKSDEMQKEIRRYMNLAEGADITIYEIMQTFNEMTKNGVRIEYNKNTKGYKVKCMWK